MLALHSLGREETAWPPIRQPFPEVLRKLRSDHWIFKGTTHKQFGDIKIRGERSGHPLQTFCLAPKGNILAVVAPPRSYGNVKLTGKNNSSEIGDPEALREQAQAQLDAEKEQFAAQAKEMQEQIDEQKTKLVEMKEALEAKDKDKITATEKRKV